MWCVFRVDCYKAETCGGDREGWKLTEGMVKGGGGGGWEMYEKDLARALHG